MNTGLPILILIISAILNLIIGGFLYFFAYILSGKKYVSALYFSQANVAVFGWTVWLTIYIYFVSHLGIAWMSYLNRVFFWVAALCIPYYLILFALSFHNRKRLFSQYTFLKWPMYLVFLLVLIPDWGLFEWGSVESYRLGSFPFWIYVTYMLTYTTTIFGVFAWRYQRIQSKEIRWFIRAVCAGLFITFSLSFGSNIGLAILSGEAGKYAYFGPMFTTIISLVMMWLVSYKRLFEIPKKLSKIMILIVGSIAVVFGRIYLSILQGSDNLVFDMLVLVSFVTLYIFLIYEVYLSISKERTLQSNATLLNKLITSKNEFLRSATHQLRTPLTVIIGYVSDLINPEIKEYKINDATRNGLKKILISAQNLNLIINDLVATNDINGGKFGINIHDEADIKTLIDYILDEKESLMDDRGTKVELSVDQEHYPCLVDRSKFREALNNIIDNAIFYGKGQIWIDISASHPVMYKITVRDNGVGISSKEIHRIWKKFERGEKSPTINPNGSGLGLYIARMVMRKHGGNLIGVSKGQDQGSTFTFSLPKDTRAYAPHDSFGAQVERRK